MSQTGVQSFAKLAVAARHEETRDLTLLRVHGGEPEVYAAHRMPGQYVAVRLPEAEKPSYLALSSDPGSPHFEFLVRGGGRFADALRALVPGDTVEVSSPLGHGFPIDLARGSDVSIVGAGSGIAPLRPLVRKLLAERSGFGHVALVFGSRGPGHVPFRHDIAAWQAAGLEVHLVASRVGAHPAHAGNEEPWAGRHGYVQDALLEIAPDLSRAHVFACGMPAMVAALRQAVGKLGGDPDRVHTNH